MAALSDSQRGTIEECLELALGLYRRGDYAVAKEIATKLERLLEEA